MSTRMPLSLLRAAAMTGAGITFAGPLARGAFAATTASYDDGSTSIPTGLVGEPERVIIVGAGWAGLHDAIDGVGTRIVGCGDRRKQA